jgi:hypothetical protein
MSSMLGCSMSMNRRQEAGAIGVASNQRTPLRTSGGTSIQVRG